MRNIVFALIFGFGMSVPSAHAQVFLTWTGTGNNWSNTTRWTGWDSGAMPYGQLQWTGGGDPVGTNNIASLNQWRMFFNGDKAYILRGNALRLFDSNNDIGGIMSRASATQTVELEVQFRDTKTNSAYIVTRMGGSGAGGGGGELILNNLVITNTVPTLRFGTEPGAGRISVNGVLAGAGKQVVIGRDHTNGVQPSTFVQLRGNNTYSGGTWFRGGTLRVGDNNALGSGTFRVDGEGASARTLSSHNSTAYTLSNTFEIYNDFTIGQPPPSGGTGSLTFTGEIRLGNETNETRTLTINGTHTFAGMVTGQRGIVKTGQGTLRLNGANTYAGPTILANGTLGGIGSISNSALSGFGVIEPGAGGPGIFTAASMNPSSGLKFAFEFTGTAPDFGNRAASVNDVLHLLAPSPFTVPLDGGNDVDVFFNLASIAAGQSYTGGFFTSATDDFLARIDKARYRYFIRGDGNGGDARHNGQGYYLLSNWNADLAIERATVAANGGRITQFNVVAGAPVAFYAVEATDRASFYSFSSTGAQAWQHDANRADTVFGVWELTTSPNGGAVGHFVGDSSLGGADINSGGKAFGMYANPPIEPNPSAAAVRKFAQPVLRTGDSISFRIAANFRNGNKGFSLRDTNEMSQLNFNVGSDGYFIRNGPSATTSADNGQQLGGYHANTIFTFTFTQRERRMDWVIERFGGISAVVRGQLAVNAGTIADVRFYVTATDAGGLPENNLYFNDITFATERRGDEPLTLGERRMPGRTPSYFLRFKDPVAGFVNFRSERDWNTSYGLTNVGENVWQLDIRTVPGLTYPGYHAFRFRMEGGYEAGNTRLLYLDAQGRIAKPPAVYLTWTNNPTTTMVVQWHNYDVGATGLQYRLAGSTNAWSTLSGSTTPFPFAERLVHTAGITGLTPGTEYEFMVDGYDETYRFRTMPAALDEPVRFAVGGDVDIGTTAEIMTAAIAAKDPHFLVIGGDHPYADGKAENFTRWYRYFQMWRDVARAPDGRLIPLVVGIGNHEVRYGFTKYHPDFENTREWRLRQAPYYYRTFAFPGDPGYGVLDFGDYMSMVVLDSDHSNLIINQTNWLAQVLNARRNRPHLIPVYHVPAYTSNRQQNDEFSTRVRTHWVPLFEAAGVQLAFEHHDHTRKRTKTLLGGVENSDGIVYAGDGLWGIDHRVPDTSRPYLANASTNHHVYLVTITATGRTMQAIGLAGNTLDQFSQGIDGIPAAPAVNIASLATNAISLSWAAVPRAAKYKIIRSDGWTTEVTATNFTDSAWRASSNFTYVIEAINRSGHSTEQPQTAAAPSQVWMLEQGLPWNGDLSGPANADGRPLAVYYFHGLDPAVPMATNPVQAMTAAGGTEFGMRFRKSRQATDVAGRVFTFTNLMAPSTWTNEITPVLDAADGPDADWYRATVPVGADREKFLLLRIQE